MSDVIQFKPSISFNYKKVEDKQRYCEHINVLVDEEKRLIQCNECDIVLDPFDYLKKVCYSDQSAFTKHSQLLVEFQKLEKRYKNLTLEIERLNRVKKQLK